MALPIKNITNLLGHDHTGHGGAKVIYNHKVHPICYPQASVIWFISDFISGIHQGTWSAG